MRNLLSKAAKYRAEARRRKLWQRAVSLLVCVVVFVTTYAQILPAIALEADLFEPDGHVHTDECYKIVKTEEKTELDCPLELHTHTAACYDADGALVCGYADFVVHTHDSFCYDENGKRVCTLPEIEEHTHTALCYPVQVDGPAAGTGSTGEAHVHTDECYTETPGALLCEQEETDGHTHTEDCYVETEQLVCELEESEGHTHTDLCMDTEGLPELCGLEETEGHTHDESCYETVQELVCEQEEAEPHTHTEDCYAPEEKELTCGFEENESEEKSEGTEEKPDPFAGEDEDLQPICGQDEIELHTHTAACFGAGGAVVCGQLEVLEHQHTEDCLRVVQEASEEKVLDCAYTSSEDKADDEKPADSSAGEDKNGEKPADSDSTGEKPADSGSEKPADSGSTGEDKDKDGAESDGTGGETSDDETPAPGGDVDGDPDDEPVLTPATLAERVLAAAESYIGYKEDTEDCDIDADGEMRGLTQFGLHYGMPYEKWDAMFVAYCLEEAGAEELPSAADCLFDIDVWASMLDGAGYCQTAELYTPAPGDVAFFDLDGDGTLDHVAFVEKVTDTRLFVIAGDSSDCVRRASYARADESVVGYGVLPRDEDEPQDSPADEPDEDEGAAGGGLTGEPSEDETEDDPAASDPMDEPQDGEDGKTDEKDPDKPDEDGKTDKAGEGDKTAGKDDDKKNEDTDQDSTQEAALGLAGRVLAAAQAEFGYTSAPDGTTLYRAFYDDPTAPLDVLFVAYCLDQAGIEGVPSAQDSGFDSEQWRAALAEAGMFRAAGAEEAAPAPGEVLFLDKDGDGAADFVAIVEKVAGGKVHVLEMAEAPAVAVAALALDTDEENSGETTASAAASCVRRMAYGLTDTQVLGYTALASLEDEDTALTEEEQAQVDAVIALIDALPDQETLTQKMAELNETGDEDAADAYLTELRTAAIAAYKAYEKLTEEQRQKVTNAEKLLALEWLWSAETLPDESLDEAKIDAVIALIEALPSAEEIRTTLQNYHEVGDDEGYETYLSALTAQVKEAYSEYSALTKEQKEKVTNAERLLALEWLWSAQTPDEGGKIEPLLNGDYAYLVNAGMKTDDKTTSGYAVRTGTADFDADDVAGNDSSELNNILRTFDTASFTIEFSTKLRDEILQNNIAGYETGRLFFEFILPANRTQAQFEINAMGWLESSQGIAYEIINDEENGRQIMRGSYLLVANDSNPAAIGASTNELSIVIRALQMKNGDTLQPSFTLWLDHNDVGVASSDQNIPQGIVTGTEYDCAEHQKKEFVTIIGPPITISAAPRYNISLTKGDVRSTKIGTYDFDATSNTNAINYGIGSRYGRLSGYGLIVEIRGKAGQGMRGVELPDMSKPIEFDVEFSATYNGESTDQLQAYQPLFWSGGANKSGNSNADGREVNTSSNFIVSIPNNSGTPDYNSCYNGGTWTFTSEEAGKVHVEITGFQINTERFPYTSPSAGQLSYTYYNPNNIENYWEIDRAVFSAGELWLLLPYEDKENGTYIVDAQGEGEFKVKVADSNLSMYGSSGAKCITQAVENDDRREDTVYVKNPGSIDARMCYVKYGTRTWNNALTSNGYDNDTDWAVAGQGVTLEAWISHDGSEEEYQGVAYDMLLKFDGNFFEPDGDNNVSPTRGLSPTVRYFWAAKEDGSNWTNDEEMKSATEDDLVYYSTLRDVKAAGAIPVALLVEWRGVSSSAASMNHYHIYVDGKIKTEDTGGNVYLFTRTSYAWNKNDIRDEVIEYYSLTGGNEPTDAQYTEYARDVFPSRGNQSLQMLDRDKQENWNVESSYPKPFWRQDYYVSNGTGRITTGEDGKPAFSNNTKMLQKCEKATYKDDGYHAGVGAPYYQDSCLVVPFATTISKKTAQEVTVNGVTTPKKVYDMSQNQCTVDYVLSPKIERTQGEGESGSSALTVTIHIQDTLPAGMTYIPKTAYLGGTYTSDPKCQVPGTVVGGELLVDDVKTHVKTDLATGVTTLTWDINVTIDANEPSWTGNIYFSCTIPQEVKHQQQLNNEVIIWADGEQKHGFKEEYGNKAIYGIEIEKMNATSLSKVADQLVVDWWEEMGFTMNVGNNSSNDKTNTIIVETLPYNGDAHTQFDGPLVVSSFLAGATTDKTESETLMSEFTFYYTTDTAFRNCSSESLKKSVEEAGLASNPTKYFENSGSWTKLSIMRERGPEYTGLPYHCFTDFPTESNQSSQIIAIVAVGDLPAGKTLSMHITLKLTNGKKGNVLYNYLSQDALTSYASTQVVSRALEGLAWEDANGNGLQDFSEGEEGEKTISNVKVSLLKLVGRIPGSTLDEKLYEAVTYNEKPVVIKTGQQVSVQTGQVTQYEQGRYKFVDLEAGYYAVKFENAEGNEYFSILGYFASPENKGQDDTTDSDGIPTYSQEGLQQTVILGIDLTEDSHSVSLMEGEYISKHNDSGFYEKSYELPETGGSGTGTYVFVGGTLMAGALLYAGRRKRKGGM